MSPPTFFFSYARQDDWSNYLNRFFEDLENTVAQWSGHSLQDGPLGTIDQRFPVSEDWATALAEALSHGSAFVMAESPVYYSREDCGKELRAFLRRSAELGIDAKGALTGAKNVIRVRWMPEAAYSLPPHNGIPAILGRIQYVPPQLPDDEDRKEAIKRYVKKGMKGCVDQQPYYTELLDAFAEAIVRSAGTLPPGEAVAFEAEDNAFEFDWCSHFDSPPQDVPLDVDTGEVREPEGLRSVVAFHVTQRPFAAAPDAITFADVLIAENPGRPSAHPVLANLLAELRNAALEENLLLFNAAPAPPLPFDVQRLAGQLRALMDRGVSTLMVIDSQWLLAQPAGVAAALLRQVLDAVPDWSGAVVIADDAASGAETLVPAGGPFGVPGASVLPSGPAQRALDLRRILVETRGRAMRSLASKAADPSTIPLLSAARSRAA